MVRQEVRWRVRQDLDARVSPGPNSSESGHTGTRVHMSTSTFFRHTVEHDPIPNSRVASRD